MRALASCDMCGKDSDLYKTKIEGTVMNVCRNCSRFGKVLGEVKIAIKDSEKEKLATIYVPEKEEVTEEIVQDFAQKILKARQAKKMEQKDFARFLAEKESVISKLETGNMKPSMKLARKLQNRLGIRLIQVNTEEKYETEKTKSDEFTLGDFIKVRKK